MFLIKNYLIFVSLFEAEPNEYLDLFHFDHESNAIFIIWFWSIIRFDNKRLPKKQIASGNLSPLEKFPRTADRNDVVLFFRNLRCTVQLVATLTIPTAVVSPQCWTYRIQDFLQLTEILISDRFAFLYIFCSICFMSANKIIQSY